MAYEVRISDWSSDVCSSDLLHDDHIKAGRLAGQHGLAGAPGDAAQRAARRRGPDESLGMARQFFHAGLVAEDRAAADLGGGIDRQHRHFVARLDPQQAEALDEGRTADAGHAADADATGGPPERHPNPNPPHRPTAMT